MEELKQVINLSKIFATDLNFSLESYQTQKMWNSLGIENMKESILANIAPFSNRRCLANYSFFLLK